MNDADRHAQEWRQDVVNCCNALMTQYQSLLNSATINGLGGGDAVGAGVAGGEKRDEVERVVRTLLDEKAADEEATRAAALAAAGKDAGEVGGGELPSGVVAGVDLLALKGQLATENIAEVCERLLELVKQLEMCQLMTNERGE
ncbi:hypothetical protein TrCOL_g2351 [Triparma columacea]|uniref:Uncharacterized protein n=1 Tax=Triparma columacea TaxID=722753 RepID=A0A9W7GEI8_9STRA|nr:hypothetical protein TrCOL_g2351 [Triparma columacea]